MLVFPDPVVDVRPISGKQTAVLAGGCFWCTEAVFEIVEGVESVISGYAGDSKETAKYDIVSTGRTGHAESILITYDPARISYGQLLKIFFSVAHDPTTLNRQGADVGSQYRSAIFYADEEQKRVAEAYIKQLNAAGVFTRPIVTQVVPLDKFYTAEDYHQNYAVQNRSNPYIVSVSDPKVAKLKKMYPGCVRKRK
ncbi:MAG: peptide-methionine (S)-S-oxide reductase MsrA [Bryobacteraceae bacterium]